MSGRIRFNEQPREPKPDTAIPITTFALSRAIFGLFLGLTLGVLCPLQDGDASRPLLVIGVGIIASCLIACVHAKDLAYAILPALVLVILWSVSFPFTERGIAGLIGATPAIIYLAYSMLSSFQLSELKEQFGIGEAKLCAIDKLAYVLGLGIGGTVSVFFHPVEPSQGPDHPVTLVFLAVALALVFGSFWVVSQLISTRKENEVKTRIEEARQERLSIACQHVADEFRLSAREYQTLQLLVDGHTRSHIARKLGVGEGTAKTYIARVYQKLDIHHKDELISFMKARME